MRTCSLLKVFDITYHEYINVAYQQSRSAQLCPWTMLTISALTILISLHANAHHNCNKRMRACRAFLHRHPMHIPTYFSVPLVTKSAHRPQKNTKNVRFTSCMSMHSAAGPFAAPTPLQPSISFRIQTVSQYPCTGFLKAYAVQDSCRDPPGALRARGGSFLGAA